MSFVWVQIDGVRPSSFGSRSARLRPHLSSEAYRFIEFTWRTSDNLRTIVGSLWSIDNFKFKHYAHKAMKLVPVPLH